MTRLADAEHERIWGIVVAKGDRGCRSRQIARATGVSPTRNPSAASGRQKRARSLCGSVSSKTAASRLRCSQKACCPHLLAGPAWPTKWKSSAGAFHGPLVVVDKQPGGQEGAAGLLLVLVTAIRDDFAAGDRSVWLAPIRASWKGCSSGIVHRSLPSPISVREDFQRSIPGFASPSLSAFMAGFGLLTVRRVGL